MSDTPTCNQCGAEISWNKTVRDNFGIKGPLEPDETKKHTCDEERKKAYKANKAAEELAQKDARDKAAAMGGTGTGTGGSNGNISGIEIYLKGQLEEIRRAVDHLGKIAMFAESLDFRVKKIEESIIYSSVPPRPDLSESSSSETLSEEEVASQ